MTGHLFQKEEGVDTDTFEKLFFKARTALKAKAALDAVFGEAFDEVGISDELSAPSGSLEFALWVETVNGHTNELMQRFSQVVDIIEKRRAKF